jgi:hypothetical protein
MDCKVSVVLVFQTQCAQDMQKSQLRNRELPTTSCEYAMEVASLQLGSVQNAVHRFSLAVYNFEAADNTAHTSQFQFFLLLRYACETGH